VEERKEDGAVTSSLPRRAELASQVGDATQERLIQPTAMRQFAKKIDVP